MKDFFSQDLKSLIDELTVKDPKKRLGNPQRGGVNQIKRHPFFKRIDWDEVLNKQLTPPIVPEKKKGVVDLVSGDANPYRLLEQNFNKATVLDAVYLYESQIRDDGEGKTGDDSDNLHRSVLSDVTGFTFDEDIGNNTRTSDSKDSLDKNLLLRRPHTSLRTEKVGSPKTSPMDTIMEEEDGMELTKSLSSFSATERTLSERYD